MSNTVGQKMSDYPLLSTLTQEERETYMQNVAMTTFGMKDNTGNKINVNVPLNAIIPTVPVTDVTVGGTSVVSGGVAAVPSVPDASSLADGTSITSSNGKLSAAFPVTDVTVGGNSVVSNGVAAVPAQENADWEAASGVTAILNKPDLSIYALQSALETLEAKYTSLDARVTKLEGQTT